MEPGIVFSSVMSAYWLSLWLWVVIWQKRLLLWKRLLVPIVEVSFPANTTNTDTNKISNNTGFWKRTPTFFDPRADNCRCFFSGWTTKFQKWQVINASETALNIKDQQNFPFKPKRTSATVQVPGTAQPRGGHLKGNSCADARVNWDEVKPGDPSVNTSRPQHLSVLRDYLLGVKKVLDDGGRERQKEGVI